MSHIFQRPLCQLGMAYDYSFRPTLGDPDQLRWGVRQTTPPGGTVLGPSGPPVGDGRVAAVRTLRRARGPAPPVRRPPDRPGHAVPLPGGRRPPGQAL